ncbi:MAG: hypothetical protein QM784_04430, partial [Polyangiaceae bacterium]
YVDLLGSTMLRLIGKHDRIRTAPEDIADQDDNVVADQGSETTETATEALRYPGGSWVLTCPSRTVRYDSSGNPAQIIADCYNKKHKLVHNRVWVWDCSTGCFWNDDGHLKCGNC